MPSDFGTLATAIATAVATTGLRMPADGSYPDQITPPCALLTPTDDEGLNLDDTNTLETFELLVAVQAGGSMRAAMAALHPYLSRTGAQSVRLALRTGLGGNLIRVTRRQVGRFDVDGTIVVGARFELEVISQ